MSTFAQLGRTLQVTCKGEQVASVYCGPVVEPMNGTGFPVLLGMAFA